MTKLDLVFDLVGKEFTKFDKYDELMLEGNMLPSAARLKSGISDEIADYIESLHILSAAEMTAEQKSTLFTMALKEQAAAFVASPLFKISAAIAIAWGAVKLFKYFDGALDRSREKLSELKNEYGSNESELSSLEGELTTTTDRIKELEALKTGGSFSVADQEELDSLRARNLELSRTIDLLELQRDVNRDLINSSFVNTINERIKRDRIEPGSTSMYGGYIIDTDSELDWYLNAYENYQRDLFNLDEKYSSDLAQAKEDGDQKEEERLKSKYAKEKALIEKNLTYVKTYLSEMQNGIMDDISGVTYTPETKASLDWANDFLDRYSILMGKDNAKSNAFNRLITQSFPEATKGLQELGETGEVTAEMLEGMLTMPGFDAFIAKCKELGVISDIELGSGLAFLASLFNGVGASAGSAAEGLAGTTITLEQINEHIDNFQTRTSSLSDALIKLNEGSLSLGEVVDLIQEFPELIEYVDFASESFGDLASGLKKLIRESPEDLIDELERFAETADLTDEQRKSVKELTKALRDMSSDAISNTSSEFGILADRMNASSTAKKKLDAAMSGGDYDDGYDYNIQAFKEFKDLFKNGEVGGKAFAAYKEYFGVSSKSLDELGAWFNTVNKYFQGGETGVNNFLNTIAKLGGEGGILDGVASYDPKTGEFWYEFMSVDELADVIGLEEKFIQDFFGKIRMKSPDWQDRSTEDTRNELVSEGLIFELDDGTIIASLDGIAKYLNYVDGEANGAAEAVRALITEFNLLENPKIDFSNDEKKKHILDDLGEGGAVDLTIRPKVSGKTLAENGWDGLVADEVYSLLGKSFSNDDGSVWANFTPIMTDENGNYIGALDPTEFGQYARDVLNGVREDDLNLQIGASFEGEEAADDASHVLDLIQRYYDNLLNDDGTHGIKLFGEDQITITQDLIDGLEDSGASVEDIEKALGDLNKVMDLEYDPDVMIGDKSIQDVLAEQAGIGKEEEFTIKITAKGSDEVLAEVTTTKDAINEQVRSIDSFEVSADCEDEASVSIEHIEELIQGLDGASATVNATKGPNLDETLSAALSLAEALERIAANANPVINATGNLPGQNAAGTKHAKRGPSLLGEEYSPTGSPKPELVVSKDGAYIAGLNGPEMGYLNDGDIVYNADDTKEILRGNKNPHMIQAFGGGTVPPPKKPSGGFSGDSKSTGKNVDPSSEFEELYDYHQHLIAMDQESMEDYLEWLDKAYQEAFDNNEIDKKDYWKYQEEVYEELKELFNDYVDDVEHQINLVINNGGDNRQVVNMYQQLMKEIEAEIAKAKEKGLDENNEYVQELQEKLWDFQEEIDDIQEEIEEDAKDSIDDLIDYRIDMLKQELTDEKELLNDKLSNLKDFYSEQKELLKDAADEEEYIKNQTEKRKAVSDIQEEMARLRFDDSAFAKKRMLELQEELKEAEEELSEFEKDRALDDATELLDNLYEKQEEQIKSQIEDLDDRLNDPEALYNQALKDIQNNTLALYEEMVEYNNRHGSGNPEEINTMWKEADEALDKFLNLMGHAYKGIILQDAPELEGYSRGTANATPGVHEVDEKGSEYVFTSSDGRRYRVFSGGEKILNANATNFLYKFATYGNDFFSGLFGSISKQLSGIQMNSKQIAPSITLGDIIVQGNADRATVSEIRREKRDEMRWILQEFNKMNKRI